MNRAQRRKDVKAFKQNQTLRQRSVEWAARQGWKPLFKHKLAIIKSVVH